MSEIDIFGPISPKKLKIFAKHIKKWMILILLAKFYMPIKMKIFLDAHASLYLLVPVRPSARPPVSVSLRRVNATST